MRILLFILLLTLFSCNCPTCPKDKPPHVIYDNYMPEGVIIDTYWTNGDYIVAISKGATVTKIVLDESMRYDINVNDTIRHEKTF